MPPSRKVRHAAAVQEPRIPAKQQRQQQQQQQQRSPSPDHAVGKGSSASTSTSTGATARAAPRLRKGSLSRTSVTSSPVGASNPRRHASAATSWRAQLLHLATQEAYTAATLLRLLPSTAPADARDGVQPNQLLLGTAAPPPAPCGAGAAGGARVQTAQTARMARRSAYDASAPTAPAATTEAASPPTHTIKWTSYGELWEGLLARLPLVNGANDAAKPTPATGGNSDGNGITGGGKRCGGESAGHRGDKKAAVAAALAHGGAKAGDMNSPATDVSSMLSNDWRSFFLHRRLSGTATAGGRTCTAAPPQGHQAAARPQRRRLDNLTCSPYMTHAEQRAIRRYTAAAIASVPSGVRRGLSTICVLDFL